MTYDFRALYFSATRLNLSTCHVEGKEVKNPCVLKSTWGSPTCVPDANRNVECETKVEMNKKQQRKFAWRLGGKTTIVYTWSNLVTKTDLLF